MAKFELVIERLLVRNGVRTKIPQQSRNRRIQIKNPNRLRIERKCDGLEDCKTICIGQLGYYTPEANSEKSILVRGEALFIVIPISTYSSCECSSVSYDPVNRLWLTHQNGLI